MNTHLSHTLKQLNISAPWSCFIAGTDTGIGKTYFATLLLKYLTAHSQYQHLKIVGMKPVAAGTTLINGVLNNDDVIQLRAASNTVVSPQLDNPVLLHEAVSPHIAAAKAGLVIDIPYLVACHQTLMQQVDIVVVEGAGGFYVPLSPTTTGADLAIALNIPIILVVGLRLGCLNHAHLTAQAIRREGLQLVGWVANELEPNMPVQQDNIQYLQGILNVPLLAHIPYQNLDSVVINNDILWN
jgi:dethiobiotin synthetase